MAEKMGLTERDLDRLGALEKVLNKKVKGLTLL